MARSCLGQGPPSATPPGLWLHKGVQDQAWTRPWTNISIL